jgi:RNA polymerase sigma-70 factor (ECF subfamily)
MRLPEVAFEPMSGDTTPFRRIPKWLSGGEKRPHFLMLVREESATDGQHAVAHFGRKHMSYTDTRASVIDGVCRHEPERWREFDAIYRPILFAFLRKLGVEPGEASEVAQDILVKLLDTIQTYDRSKCRFRTWLFRVTRNTLIDRARRKASYKKALDGWAAQVLRASESESVQMEIDLLRIHREKILGHALKVVRARVSSKAWVCFEQRLLSGRPAAEIARDLQIEPNNVYVNACRVLKQVRSVCEEFDEDISHACESDVSR